MKRKKHDRLVREAVVQALNTLSEQHTTAIRNDRKAANDEQDREDIALIAAGMIPVRVFRRHALRGGAKLEREARRLDGPIETTYSVSFHSSDPVLDAAFRAIDVHPDDLPF